MQETVPEKKKGLDAFIAGVDRVLEAIPVVIRHSIGGPIKVGYSYDPLDLIVRHFRFSAEKSKSPKNRQNFVTYGQAALKIAAATMIYHYFVGTDLPNIHQAIRNNGLSANVMVDYAAQMWLAGGFIVGQCVNAAGMILGKDPNGYNKKLFPETQKEAPSNAPKPEMMGIRISNSPTVKAAPTLAEKVPALNNDFKANVSYSTVNAALKEGNEFKTENLAPVKPKVNSQSNGLGS